MTESYWTIPKLWSGETAFILGGGPSLNDVNFDLIKEKRVIGVNNAYLLGSWVDICWFGDSRWWGWHKEKLSEFPGLIVSCATSLVKNNYNFLKIVARGKPRGIEQKPNCVSWNRNSGISAINFAYHLGVKRVVLLGFDMRRIDNKTNWHDQHPCPDKNPYEMFLRVISSVQLDAQRLKLEIINATPGSAIKVFPTMRLEEVVDCSIK